MTMILSLWQIKLCPFIILSKHAKLPRSPLLHFIPPEIIYQSCSIKHRVLTSNMVPFQPAWSI